MYDESPVNVRIRLAGLWTSMLFVFAYVDLFSLYREDVRADLEAGTLGGFTVGDTFLLATTAYVLVPALMVFLSLVLAARVVRIATIVLAIAYALTCVGGAIGERPYYLLGTVVEVLLLTGVVSTAWRWPRRASAPASRGVGGTVTARTPPAP